MIKQETLKTHPFSYPILKSNNLLNDDFYNTLKHNWPDFKEYRTSRAGQVSRNNIEFKKNNENYEKIDASFRKLYDEFNSVEFRTFLEGKFNLNEAKKIGYIGDFGNSELVMHVAESVDGYENPWHIDTRSRIINFLIYFGDETIKEGGELSIGEHKELDNYLDYKQYPKLCDLKNIQYFLPKNNLGIFILSQHNSYHKGCAVKGLRRFIYAGYTDKNRHPSWKIKHNWQNKKSFVSQLKYEKSQ
jgi:hypothetical protein